MVASFLFIFRLAVPVSIQRGDLLKGRDLGHVEYILNEDSFPADAQAGVMVDGEVAQGVGRCRWNQRVRGDQNEDENGKTVGFLHGHLYRSPGKCCQLIQRDASLTRLQQVEMWVDGQ